MSAPAGPQPAAVPAAALALRLAEWTIRMACRKLPRDERAERELEWAVEAEAVATDPEARFAVLRAAAVLWFALSLLSSVRATRRTAPAARKPLRQRIHNLKPGAIRAVAVALALAGGIVGLVAVGVAVAAVVVIINIVIIIAVAVVVGDGDGDDASTAEGAAARVDGEGV